MNADNIINIKGKKRPKSLRSFFVFLGLAEKFNLPVYRVEQMIEILNEPIDELDFLDLAERANRIYQLFDGTIDEMDFISALDWERTAEFMRNRIRSN